MKDNLFSITCYDDDGSPVHQSKAFDRFEAELVIDELWNLAKYPAIEITDPCGVVLLRRNSSFASGCAN